MNRKLRLHLLLGSLFLPILLAACADNYRQDELQSQPSTERQQNAVSMPSRVNILEGVLHIELKESPTEGIKPLHNGLQALQAVSTQLSQTLNKIQCYNAEPLFPADPRFEKRHKAYGLDRWYRIEFKDTDPLHAKALLSRIREVERAEECYRMSYEPAPETSGGTVAAPAPADATPTESKDMPFNDPLLYTQWHYHNDGSRGPSAKARADINLFEAWKIETGKPNVVVAVTDAGIDYTHEDLKESMWVNEAEKNGVAGVDDDGNGYVDDVYGYSFVYYKSDPQPDGEIPVGYHGTHVGGTIAARNNNGLGVCGVAGGNGDPNSGVRLMSLAIFRGEREGGNSASTYVYAADNGAVISQNSWGYSYPSPQSLPSSLRLAIDYFIDNAGIDADGNQRPDSPMKGGIVIFAAGNDGEKYSGNDYKGFPAAYPRVMAVSSMIWNFKRATYTDRGSWVDIMAPGGYHHVLGEAGGVISCYPTTGLEAQDKKYGTESGTSMACPHVSGIAGLVVSHFGGPGFTNKDLWKRLVSSLRPYDINKYNPGYEDVLGAGYIDAAEALDVNQNIAPEAPEILDPKIGFVKMDIVWKVAPDKDDTKALRYFLYMSENALNASNYSSARLLGPEDGRGIINPEKALGESFVYSLSGLKTNTTYHFALLAEDKWGLKSPVKFFSYKTLQDFPPVLKGLPEKIQLTNIESKEYTLTVEDPEGHSWSYDLEGETKGITVVRQENQLKLTIRPVLQPGEHSLVIVLRDELGEEAKYQIPFRIVEYKPPRFIGGLENMIMGIDDSFELKLDEMFEHTDIYPLKLSVQSSDGGVVSAEIKENNVLHLQPHRLGKANIKINSTDGIQEGDEVRFQVRIVHNAQDPIHLVYPIPAAKHLNILAHQELKSFKAVVTTLRGEKVLEKTLHTDSQHTARLSLRKLSTGTYVLHVKERGVNYQKIFVKK